MLCCIGRVARFTCNYWVPATKHKAILLCMNALMQISAYLPNMLLQHLPATYYLSASTAVTPNMHAPRKHHALLSQPRKTRKPP